MLSWLAILKNERVHFSFIDVLFGKFDIVEDFIVIYKSHSFACKVLYL